MERGCARSVSHSAFKLLRLVCDTAALRPKMPACFLLRFFVPLLLNFRHVR